MAIKYITLKIPVEDGDIDDRAALSSRLVSFKLPSQAHRRAYHRLYHGRTHTGAKAHAIIELLDMISKELQLEDREQ